MFKMDTLTAERVNNMATKEDKRRFFSLVSIAYGEAVNSVYCNHKDPTSRRILVNAKAEVLLSKYCKKTFGFSTIFCSFN